MPPEGTQADPKGEGQEPTQPTALPADGSGGGQPAGAAESVDRLPDWAQRIIRDLRKESADHRKKATAADEASRLAEENRLKEQAKWQELAEAREKELATLKAERAAEQLAALRREVAQAAGLPADMADRLRGESKEEIEADARELKKLLPATTPAPPGAPAGPKRDSRSATLDEAKREAVRRRFGINP